MYYLTNFLYCTTMSFKNNLSNKLSKEEAIARLEKESFKRITVSFYKYVHIVDINFFRNELYKKWCSLNIFGRIYLANEGINAQISIPEDNLNNSDIEKAS